MLTAIVVEEEDLELILLSVEKEENRSVGRVDANFFPANVRNLQHEKVLFS